MIGGIFVAISTTLNIFGLNSQTNLMYAGVATVLIVGAMFLVGIASSLRHREHVTDTLNGLRDGQRILEELRMKIIAESQPKKKPKPIPDIHPWEEQ